MLTKKFLVICAFFSKLLSAGRYIKTMLDFLRKSYYNFKEIGKFFDKTVKIVQNFEVKNKKDSFADQLKTLILSGRIKVGDKLPPERELAENYGISRCSVNQGLLDLERAGFIRIEPRKGAYVAEYFENATPETLAAIMNYDADLVDRRLFTDLMEMRILVECECARLTCANRRGEVLDALHTSAERLFSADDESLVDAIYGFHRCVVRSTGNLAYALIFQSFETLLRRLISVRYSNRAELKRMLPKYVELVSALILGEAERASALMYDILKSGEGYLSEYLSTRE